jgi:hypothetical protein
LLTACGGSQPPIGAPGVMLQASAITRQAARGKSWMLPEAKSEDLLYVTDVRTTTVYSYPSGKYLGTLRHFYIANGACVDKKGNVFVVDAGYGKIFEYAHGGTKRIATLDSPSPDPSGCSVDATTGDLAVSTLGFGANATVAIFHHARGTPKTFESSGFKQYWFCGYDDKGNLFIDGVAYPGGTGDFAFAEIPKGGNALKLITLNRYVGWPGGVQWDGKHVVVGDQYAPAVYRFSIHGHQGTLVGTTPMGGDTNDVAQFFIQSNVLITPNQIHGGVADVNFFSYPSGGDPTKTITRHVEASHGAVVSLAPHR